MTPLRELRPLGWGAYGVALLLVAIPVLDSLITIWPLQPGNLTWRFGAVGLLSRSVMSPLFGLLVALAAAILMEHRGVTRALALVSFGGALLAAAALGVFVFDALETRPQIRPEAAQGFDAAAVLAVLKYGAGVVVATLLGRAGWRASRRPGSGPGAESPSASRGIVVGRARPGQGADAGAPEGRDRA